VIIDFITQGNIVITLQKKSLRALAAVFSFAMLAGSAAVVWAVPAAPDAKQSSSQDWAKEHHERFKHFADKMADRLEIKASQQAAWQAFTKSLEAAMEPPAKKAEQKSDAASIARMRADMAAVHAQKLAQIADATAKLQEVLSPDQRATLDQMAARFGEHRGGHRFFHHGGDGEHGGWGGHDHQHDHDHGGDAGSDHGQQH
jgi:protein CpxP